MANVRFPKPIRLDRDTYGNRELVFHIVIRATPGRVPRPFKAAVGDAVWAAVLGERQRPNVDLLAACLMPDHLHVLAKPAARSILEWIGPFKSYTTSMARKVSGEPYLWQPSFYDRALRLEDDLGQALDYVMRNPVEAGLVEEPGDWPWIWCSDGDTAVQW